MPNLSLLAARLTAQRDHELRALRREKCWLFMTLHALTGQLPARPVTRGGYHATQGAASHPSPVSHASPQS